jgi:hypothetical protein
MAVATMHEGRCRSCRVALRPRASECWFCSAPVEGVGARQRPSIGPTADDYDEDGIAFARGLVAGAAVVLVPLAIRLVLLSVA